MIKYKSIIDDFSHQEILLILGDHDSTKKYLEKKYKIEFNNEGFGAVVIPIKPDKDDFLHIFWVEDTFNFRIFDYSLLAHECFHLCFGITRIMNGDDSSTYISPEEEEYFAYHLQRIYSLILRNLLKFKERKKPLKKCKRRKK